MAAPSANTMLALAMIAVQITAIGISLFGHVVKPIMAQ
jgi:hypothetical protein